MKKKAISGGRRAYILTMRILMGAAAVITAALVLFLIAYVLVKGLPNVSWTLLSTAPSYLSDRIGILPDLLNTLYIVIATLLIVLPLGVGAAIYLTEYATNRRVIGVIEYAAETLSGIPSIIYGLVGMLFFCQFLNMKTSLLAGALTLASRPCRRATARARSGSARASGASSARWCCPAVWTASSPAASCPSGASSASRRRCCSRRALPTRSTAFSTG